MDYLNLAGYPPPTQPILRHVVPITARCSLARRNVSLSMRATLEIKGLDQGIEKLPLTARIDAR